MQKAIALDPGDWSFYLNLALMQLRSNQPDAAEANFKKAIELNPKATDAHLMLANYYQVRSRLAKRNSNSALLSNRIPRIPNP